MTEARRQKGEMSVEAGRSNGAMRSAVMGLMLVAGISLLLWAGVHNARDRRLEAQKILDGFKEGVEILDEIGAAPTSH